MLHYIRNATHILFGTKKSEPVMQEVVVQETPNEKTPFPEMYYYAVMNGLSIRAGTTSEAEEINEQVPENAKPDIKPIDQISFANLMLDMSRKAAIEGVPETLKP